MVRVIMIGLGVLLGIAALAVWQRHNIVFYALSNDGMPPLLDAQDEGPGVRWVDDYFTVEVLDESTFAIGEPRYAQQNFSFLIVGSDRAVLFDAGPGYYDIRSVAESLTDKPITFVPSHFHFDHTGNTITFESVAVVDLPYLRKRAPDDKLALTSDEHLGWVESVENITLEVDEWIAPGTDIDLGDRKLEVLYTPGHTEDSISLFDRKANILFTGDFIIPGPLFAFLPNSGMGDYVHGTETVLAAVPDDVRIYAAHRMEGPGAPQLVIDDLRDLKATLDSIQSGDSAAEGFYPVIYKVNDRIDIWAEPSFLQNWSPPIRHIQGSD